MRWLGMTFPTNGLPVVGSVIVINEPLFSKLAEKLPARSSAVGVYLVCTPGLTNCPVYSCDQKKNSFFLSWLKCPGMKIGPPLNGLTNRRTRDFERWVRAHGTIVDPSQWRSLPPEPRRSIVIYDLASK